jgi:ABC-2 type transport system ATP-binding protein
MTAALSSPLLSVRGLSRRFGARVAVNDLSFEVGTGEVFGLLGPNGAGKSTTFQVLAGLLAAHAGEVVFEGQALAVSDPRLRARMGVVFQRSSLDDQLSARENLLLGARLYALPAREAKVRSTQMLELIELADRADERVAGWSGGMRRRLEVARALLHRPRILLLDEPTQGIDEASFRRIWAHLRTLREQEGLTVILTTHRPEEADGCDRLAVLDEGRLVACETPPMLAARVGGDVLTLELDRPEEAVTLLQEKFGLSPWVVEGKVLVEREEGHTLIPRLVEAFPLGRLRSVSLRRPTLGDVFVKLTGHALGADRPGVVYDKRKRKSA